jgi:hypothetical protein
LSFEDFGARCGTDLFFRTQSNQWLCLAVKYQFVPASCKIGMPKKTRRCAENRQGFRHAIGAFAFDKLAFDQSPAISVFLIKGARQGAPAGHA